MSEPVTALKSGLQGLSLPYYPITSKGPPRKLPTISKNSTCGPSSTPAHCCLPSQSVVLKLPLYRNSRTNVFLDLISVVPA